jgi:methylenetetrahydrofolate dehydrogenase (NADP+) / methenyltetrahydrofolate cyclohydrolase
MLQLISGKEIADKKEIAHTLRVQNLKEKGIVPKLAILQTISSSVIDTYVRVKKTYAEKIGIQVEHYNVDPQEIEGLIEKLNNNDSVHGIIVQLPLLEGLDQEKTLNLVMKRKDVDGLTLGSNFIPPTAQSILWLMEAYVPDIQTKKVALVGKGRLVGAPLEKELLKQEIIPRVFTKQDSLETLSEYDVIVSATGIPSLLTNTHIQSGTYIFDAGTAEENGAIHGDAADELYLRDDISITPPKGGVGILTVRALFENVLQAAESIKKNA